MRPWLIGVIGLGLLVGAYCFGRRDAPGKQDAAVSSLLDGIKAYNARNKLLQDSINALEGTVRARTRLASTWEARADSLKRTRVPLPQVVPAACHGWALNLSKCDEEQDALKKSLGATREALDATARLKQLGDSRQVRDQARMDSLTLVLRKERGRDAILGIKLPSRSTSLLAGSIAGFVVGLVVSK